jgi:hypothetical protein
MRFTFLMLLLCLDFYAWYLAPMGVLMAFAMWCLYGLNYAPDCACLYVTSMLASTMYLLATGHMGLFMPQRGATLQLNCTQPLASHGAVSLLAGRSSRPP